jgi:hypothetical protein
MVLGAYHGVEAILLDLKDGLSHWKHSEKMLKSLPLLASKDNEDLVLVSSRIHSIGDTIVHGSSTNDFKRTEDKQLRKIIQGET